MTYFPAPLVTAEWRRRKPADLGLDPIRLKGAVDYARTHDMPWPRDLTKVNVSNDKPPYDRKIGPMKPRGVPSGVVLKYGYIAAEWGDIDRVDLTFSATKSYVSAVAGLAYDRGLIRSVDDLVRDYVDDGGFEPPHNSKVAWRHLLQQTSEWEGTLFGIPDTVDWNRRSADLANLPTRDVRKAPGQHWEYNDVRVNRLALALLRVWNEPLPAVIKRELMDPIGASANWQWHGYGEHSIVDMADGRRVESVSGGAHWGGGLWIDTYDHARFGLLFLNRGVWGAGGTGDSRRILSEAWLRLMLEPCVLNPSYGFLFWLNTGHIRYGRAPESTFAAAGAGGNCVVIDPEHHMVTVTRWCSDVKGVVERAVSAATR
jgi:CubicO group peptidase (beta-lactamase class C family)